MNKPFSSRKFDAVDGAAAAVLAVAALFCGLFFYQVSAGATAAEDSYLARLHAAAEKRIDLAVLAGIGLPPRALRRLFLLLGVGIGMVGSVAGAVFGVVAATILDRTGALPLPRGVFASSSVPFRVEPGTVVLVMTVALALSVAASWFPSRMIARRDPAEGLRYE